MPSPADSERVPPAPPRRILLGILCMIVAELLFPVMSGVAKILGQHFDSVQISWARSFGQIVFMLAVFWPIHGARMFRTRRPAIQFARSAMMFTSNLAFFFAITFIPIASAAAISMVMPMIVALLAWPMLRERTTVARAVCVGVGFLGVLIVIRPGSAVFHPASIAVLLSAFCYALFQILTRKVAGIDTPETSTMYSSMVGGLGMLLVLPFVWIAPRGIADLALFGVLGLIGAIGHWFVARALMYAPANIVSPFEYFQLLGSVLVGWLLFGDLPDTLTWLGAAIIVASGLALGLTHRRRRPPPDPLPPQSPAGEGDRR